MVVPKKFISAMGLHPEEKVKNIPTNSKSTESLYSNTSSSKGSATLIYKRSPPTTSSTRQPALIPATNVVRQRVLSARRLRVKTFQNQLADAQQHIAELTQENRMLRTLHKRQDLALSKYENTNAELPQLLHSHAEEIRVCQVKYRNLQAQNKELLQKLKQKESLILTLTDQNKHLTQLSKDKHLEERQRLGEKVQKLQQLLVEKDNDMKLMARKLQLQSKTNRKELTMVQKKRKDALVQLEKAKQELSGYVKIDEMNLNEKLSKLSLGSVSNESNTSPRIKRESIEALSKLATTKSKMLESADNVSNRSSGSESETLLGSGNNDDDEMLPDKNVRSTSTHRSGPSESIKPEDVNIFSQAIAGIDEFVDTDIELDPMMNFGDNEDPNTKYEDDYEDEENDRDLDEIENLLEITSKHTRFSTSGKQSDIKSLRKEISEDFNDRESFLKTFCRQASGEFGKAAANRKNKLLATLKAIDGRLSQGKEY